MYVNNDNTVITESAKILLNVITVLSVRGYCYKETGSNEIAKINIKENTASINLYTMIDLTLVYICVKRFVLPTRWSVSNANG